MAYNDSRLLTPRQDIIRRSTFAGGDSPFNARRHVMLQSTPISQRQEAAHPPSNIDIYNITPINPVNINGQVNETRLSAMDTGGGSGIIRPFLFANDNRRPRLNQTIQSTALNNSMNVSQRDQSFDSFSNNQKVVNSGYSLRENGFAVPEPPRRSLFSPQKTDSPVRKGGPPLRSLNDLSPAIKRRRTVLEESQSHSSNGTTDCDEDAYWVTVFGFEPTTQKDAMIELFGRHGQIVKSELPVDGGNWIHIRYSTLDHVDQAVARNGQLIDKTMIGVIRSKGPNGSCSSNGSIRVSSAPERVAANTNSAVIPSRSGSIRSSHSVNAGMRSAAANGYDFGPVDQSSSNKPSMLKNFKDWLKPFG